MAYDFHPIANIFPLLPQDELSALADDIKAHGQRDPVWLYEGKVLDGRNRAKACELAGTSPTTKEFKGDRTAALAFVWSENFHRRHLNPGQTAIADKRREKLFAEYGAEVKKMEQEAAKRVIDAGKEGRKGGRGKKKTPGELISQGNPEKRRSKTRRAKAVGTNRRYLEAAGKLIETHPDKVAEVERGEKTLSQVM
jgi:hypothetical protein